ncbi:MAG: threonine transporter RhtB [Ponticaulis sp.]|nr:threonine transporter RhtB [Ponticaulis sp.]|tara:strand:- start:3438 stop:4079 length:642 start_codon:yes stop_codon:yes gene_type:complete
MDAVTALTSFSIAAALMTMTPGIDTALVLRTASVETGQKAMAAGAGISLGVLFWGLLSALGVAAVLAVSETAYLVMRIAGAAYLSWLGGQMLWAALRKDKALEASQVEIRQTSLAGWFGRGLFTNLLNPKIGVFYMSFLPQFMVDGVNPVGWSALLAGIHGLMGIAWCAAIVLAARPISQLVKKRVVSKVMDGVTGAVLVGFGLKLFFEERPA